MVNVEVARTSGGQVWEAIVLVGRRGMILFVEEIVLRGSVLLMIDNIGVVWAGKSAEDQKHTSSHVFICINICAMPY